MALKARNNVGAVAAVASLSHILKMVDIGPVAEDVQTVAEFITWALNNDQERDILRLAKIAKALRES